MQACLPEISSTSSKIRRFRLRNDFLNSAELPHIAEPITDVTKSFPLIRSTFSSEYFKRYRYSNSKMSLCAVSLSSQRNSVLNGAVMPSALWLTAIKRCRYLFLMIDWSTPLKLFNITVAARKNQTFSLIAFRIALPYCCSFLSPIPGIWRRAPSVAGLCNEISRRVESVKTTYAGTPSLRAKLVLKARRLL